jgi:hypothetical protein
LPVFNCPPRVIVWLTQFKGARLTWRSAGVIFVVAALCSIGGGGHTYAPALFYVVLSPWKDRLFWLAWMSATGLIVTAVIELLSRRRANQVNRQTRL